MPERNAARCAIGNSSDCDRNTATRSPRDKPVRLQHIGEAARHVGDLVERGARGAAILVDIDQRQPAAAVGMAVAARGRDVEPRRDVPAEIAVEGFVVVASVSMALNLTITATV